LSPNPHELEQTIDVLVLVKAYPQPSTKYTESVCVAGLRVDTPVPEWVRLYPVQFRLLKRGRQFSKYDLLRVLVRRPTSGDTRPESFTPILDTIEKIGHLPSAQGWAKRWPYIEQVKVASMCELQERQRKDGTSLGVFRPYQLTDFEITPTSPEWDTGRRAALGQGNLLCENPKLPLEKIPFDFHYSFMCDDTGCRGHRMSMIDWELGQHYRQTHAGPRTNGSISSCGAGGMACAGRRATPTSSPAPSQSARTSSSCSGHSGRRNQTGRCDQSHKNSHSSTSATTGARRRARRAETRGRR
jgi:hypothetical protein